MDSLALIVTAWLGFGVCGFAAGAVGVDVARRRLRSHPEPVAEAVPEKELVTAA